MRGKFVKMLFFLYHTIDYRYMIISFQEKNRFTKNGIFDKCLTYYLLNFTLSKSILKNKPIFQITCLNVHCTCILKNTLPHTFFSE